MQCLDIQRRQRDERHLARLPDLVQRSFEAQVGSPLLALGKAALAAERHQLAEGAWPIRRQAGNPHPERDAAPRANVAGAVEQPFLCGAPTLVAFQTDSRFSRPESAARHDFASFGRVPVQHGAHAGRREPLVVARGEFLVLAAVIGQLGKPDGITEVARNRASGAEERGRLPIGELPVDAIFSPIKRVNFDVERARVGQRTNYDRLVLELWTDGTIRPEEALAQSAQILMHHIKVVAGVDDDWFQSIELPPQIEDEPTYPPLYDKPIEELDLSVRVFNSLKRTGITSVGDVLDMLNRGPDAMLAIRNFGEKSLDELEQKLQEKNYWPHDKTEQ